MALTATWDGTACAETVEGCVRDLRSYKWGPCKYDYQAHKATRGGQVVSGDGQAGQRVVDLLIFSDCKAATGFTNAEGAMYDEWSRLTDRYDPDDGAVDFVSTRPITGAGSEVRTLELRVTDVVPAFFADKNAGKLAPGMRQAGWLLFPVKALAHYPYWRDEAKTDSTLEVSNGGATDTVTLVNGGVRNCGLDLEIIANTGATSIKLGNAATGDEFTIVKAGALTAGEDVSWFYDDPLNSEVESGWQIAPGGYMELAPGNNLMTLTWLATNGTISVKLSFKELFTSP